ncbi:TrkA family potassium uptake protein [Flavobacterium sp.]|jgi:trk system potassium uptake protein TrkA|uniref:potassium channel family protein n=1 Tax=Flavobacterium sp. TaxID=239 RepID=UPI002A8266AC|nr:TrkA family potassium uptake protein [Flavobacterium sp.]
MKIIVFGLGNFGMSLALSLTETGNEVIGIDKQMDKVNLVKDKISHAICMDSTNELAFDAVPLKDADKVVVAIGESEGAAIITTAIIKKLSDVKIISRALSPIHDTVLEAMGIHSIIHPEQESADRLTKQINFKSTLENYQLDDNYTISEVKARNEFFGKSLEELDSIDKYHLTLITIIRKKEKRNLIGKKSLVKESIGRPSPDTIIEEGDILVVYGNNKDIEKYCKGQEEYDITNKNSN